MIFHEKPEDFNPKIEVASCFIEHDGKILLLLRQDHKSAGNTWGVPAGKVDANETVEEATCREVLEETGIKIELGQSRFLKTVYVRYPTYDFVFHMFQHQLSELVSPKINMNEHKKWCWASPEEALTMDLVPDEDKCINLFYKL